jgi:hypothetical protein
MSDQNLFEVLSSFFDDVPDAVRAEISLVLTALADGQMIDVEDWSDWERDARAQFNAQGLYGRLGDLIKAIGILDVYFAADPRERLVPMIDGARHEARRNRFADRLAAIERARSDWQNLRQTSLTNTAISREMIPQFATRSKPPRYSQALH